MNDTTYSVHIYLPHLGLIESDGSFQHLFQGGGAGVQNPRNLEWGLWKIVWPLKLRTQLEQMLTTTSGGPSQKPAGIYNAIIYISLSCSLQLKR